MIRLMFVFLFSIFYSVSYAADLYILPEPHQCCSYSDSPENLVQFLPQRQDIANLRGTYHFTASGVFRISENRTARIDLKLGRVIIASFISGLSGGDIPWSININAEIFDPVILGPELFVTGTIFVNNEEKPYVYPMEVMNYANFEYEEFPITLIGQIVGGMIGSSDFIRVDNFSITFDPKQGE